MAMSAMWPYVAMRTLRFALPASKKPDADASQHDIRRPSPSPRHFKSKSLVAVWICWLPVRASRISLSEASRRSEKVSETAAASSRPRFCRFRSHSRNPGPSSLLRLGTFGHSHCGFRLVNRRVWESWTEAEANGCSIQLLP